MATQARDYLRVSLDKSGRARSLDEQHEENLSAAQRNGWTLDSSYRDRSVSASRYVNKAREGYDQLVSDLEDGMFDAEALILWESSRGSRRVGEWVLLCDLLSERGITVHVTTHGRTYDPSNPRDRRSLLEDAVDSEYESGKMSSRIRRTGEAQARAGKAPWRGAFGHPRNYRVDGRAVPVPDETVASEAQAVRELYSGLFAGRTLTNMARQMNDRGFRTTLGGPWRRVGVREVLLNPRNAGIRYYKGERVAEGQWDPIVSEETWQAAAHLLQDSTRKQGHGPARKHLGSSLYRCGKCGESTMRAKYNGSRDSYVRLYRCLRHEHNNRNADKVDTYVLATIAGRLRNEDITTLLGADDGSQLSSLHAEASALRTRLDNLGVDYASGNLTGNQARIATDRLESQLADIDERIAAVGRRNQLASMLTAHDPGQQFLDAELDVQRATVDALAVVTILPTYRGRRGPIDETVRIEPRSPEEP